MIYIMKRTQVQIPESLYEEVARVAAAREWSVSEVFRRAAEQYVAECAPGATEWTPPEPRRMGREKVPADRWRDLLAEDEAAL